MEQQGYCGRIVFVLGSDPKTAKTEERVYMKSKTATLNRQQGFTLIEIMVVMIIIGILAALIVPRVMGRPDEARRIAARQDIASIVQALKLYRLDNARYPTTEQGLTALVNRPVTDPPLTNWKAYLDNLPKDPWGSAYQYANPGLHGEIDVWSFGADGKPGGEGDDADIGNWSP